MPRLSFKPDSSFFEFIVIGAVGARGVVADLAEHGHEFVELERGSTDTKLWKDVKRKRVRIPDLVCVKCGKRIECRAKKTKMELAMSHSPTDAERAWDYGMVDSDWIAFPVCKAVKEADWSAGALASGVSYWRQKSWVQWQATGVVNYFTVAAFRAMLHARSRTKGVEEGSENVIAWDATFSTRDGMVEVVESNEGEDGKISIRRVSDGHLYAWRIKGGRQPVVCVGEHVRVNQVIASTVVPLKTSELACPDALPSGHIDSLLSGYEKVF